MTKMSKIQLTLAILLDKNLREKEIFTLSSCSIVAQLALF